MDNLDFNAGRLGLSPEELMEIGYQKLESSARLYGYIISKQHGGKVVISSPGGTVIANYSAEDILRGRAF